MKHEFKPGMLVILVWAKTPNCQHLVGTIHALSKHADRGIDYWRFAPDVILPNGNTCIWYERDMRPINNPGEDATDETLQWLEVPRKETA